MKTRKLTDRELLEWAENLSRGEDWTDVDTDMVYAMMLDTAGNEYDAGEADWNFDKSDAERMIALINKIL